LVPVSRVPSGPLETFRKPKLADGGFHPGVARLLLAVLVVFVPAAVGQKIEVVPVEGPVRGLAESGGVGLEDLLLAVLDVSSFGETIDTNGRANSIDSGRGTN